MNPWFRRFLYGIIVIIWLAIMCFPIFAFTLALRGQISIGGNERNSLRVFLVQDDAFQGIVIQRTRPLRDRPSCYRTTVNYLLWQGHSSDLNVEYCTCIDANTNLSSPVPAC